MYHSYVHSIVSKRILNALWLPLLGLFAFGSFYVVWGLLNLPSEEEVVAIAGAFFKEYGLITIFIAAVLEGTLMLGWYFPGSLVIVLGVILAHDDIPQVIGVYAATTAGIIVANIINFYLGKYGWYKLLSALGFREAIEKAKGQLLRYGTRAIYLTSWHPNFGALTATAAGILQMPLRTFVFHSAVAVALWDILWTILGYSLGDAALDAIGPKFVIAFVSLWIVAIFVTQIVSAMRQQKPSDHEEAHPTIL